MNSKLFAAAVLVIVGAAVLVPMLPDFIRYMKIRAM
jgi:hypothetical protein